VPSAHRNACTRCCSECHGRALGCRRWRSEGGSVSYARYALTNCRDCHCQHWVVLQGHMSPLKGMWSGFQEQVLPTPMIGGMCWPARLEAAVTASCKFPCSNHPPLHLLLFFAIIGWLSEPPGAAAALPAAVTDAQCKAQRQLMQGHLRHGEWKLAHTLNATVHDKCLDMAAAVAVLPPLPASNGPTSSSNGSSGGNADARLDRPGGGWADIAGCSLVSSRLSKARGGGAAAGVGSTTKVTKAAKAIVEDVRRKYAASPVSSPARRR
jgi:hypothetical protein